MARSPLALLTGVAVAGGIGWVVDASLLWFLSGPLGVSTWLAAATGFIVAGVVNFLVNRIVFHGGGQPHGAQARRYLVLFLGNLVVVSLAVPGLATLLEGVDLTHDLRVLGAKLVVTALLLPVNAFWYHRWVFAPDTT